jgi:hypothetical protein
MYTNENNYWVEISYVDGSIERLENLSLNEAWRVRSKMERIIKTPQHRAINDKHIVKEVHSGRK